MTLEARVASLIAVGASIAANCQPCLEINIGRAQKCGASAEEIAEAVSLGTKVRQGAASKMDAFAASLSFAGPGPASGAKCCG